MWNWLIVLDTVNQWLLMFVWTGAVSLGYVTPYCAIVGSTITAAVFLFATFGRKGDPKWRYFVWCAQAFYLVIFLSGFLIDFILRYAKPSVYCTPAPNDPTSCDATWKALNYTWCYFAVSAILQTWILRRISFFCIPDGGVYSSNRYAAFR